MPAVNKRSAAARWVAAFLVLAVGALAGCGSGPAPGGTGTATRPGTGTGTGTGAATSGPSPSPSPSAGTSLWGRSPASLAAVGDSITRGFDACDLLADCPEASWATGTDKRVNSLASRFGVAHRWNFARSGARVADLPEQMARAAAQRPELVTVMVGANDACRDTTDLMTPVADFRASFEQAMRRLRATAPEARVYVSSVPDLQRLWSTGRGNAIGARIWELGLCRSMLGDAHDLGASAEQRRARVHARVVAYNTVLRDVCAEDPRCRYDGGAVFAYRFSAEQLSPDWFHPSKDGQQRLAEIAYRTVTAPEAPSQGE
ncbi:SGNH/GDSL hydrolase family protein [Streptomyces sp. NPDC003036]|uniref:SGNH/GDSL hydrolase family protein n=1 Tax=Streptomyces sp. NPDC003036 TaxID=3154442 RepID=UPI0033A346C2